MRRYWGEVIAAAVVMVLSAYVITVALGLPSGGGIMPIFAAGSTLALSAFWIVRSIKFRTPKASERIRFDWSYDNLKPMVIVAVTIAYVALIFALGYFAATALYLIVGSLVLGVTSWRMIAIAVLLLLPSMYLFFVILLAVNLPEGLLL